MKEISTPSWLKWAREIQALAQTGLHYAENDYQRERYNRLTEISAEIISENSSWAKGGLIEIYENQIGYATPRVDVRGAVFQEKRLLLVRERIDGGWTLPGGWADVGDVPSQAIEREVKEESGYTVCTTSLVGVYDANRVDPLDIFHAYKIVFLCDLTGGEARTSGETSDVRLFSRDEIPSLLSNLRTPPWLIDQTFAAHNDRNWQAIFD